MRYLSTRSLTASLLSLLTLTTVSLGQIPPGQTATIPTQATVEHDPRFEAVRGEIMSRVADDIPSFAIAVAQDGKIIWEEAFGWADKEAKIEATPHTIYPVAKAEVNAHHVQRGIVEPETLRAAARTWQPIAQRLAFLEGTSHLTVAQVRAKALHAMQQHQETQCLIIVDYLQLWAKLANEFRSASAVRERVDILGSALHELALRLQSPVLALSSQNRSQGNYGNGKGTAALDSLKESGDLEYAADVVLFLTEAKARQARPPARPVDLTIAKNRHGETGTINLIFRPDLGILREEAQ